MLDGHNRKIEYMRISVTDKCNLRCTYCMPEEGIKLIPHKEILSFEEICRVVEVAAGMGIKKIKLTGGEPLVRRDITSLVSMIAKVKRVEDLSMTTNGILLGELAESLASAGLMRVNISLDTLDPDKYKTLTRGGDIANVFKGIDAALKAGLVPIKLNCVITGRPSSDKEDVARLAKEKGIGVQFIKQMSLSSGIFSHVEGGQGGRCGSCNRIRMTSNGIIKPCLFNDMGYEIKKYGIEKALEQAILNKPPAGETSRQNTLYNMGG